MSDIFHLGASHTYSRYNGDDRVYYQEYLMEACITGNLENVKSLIAEYPGLVNSHDEGKFSPLLEAVSNGYFEIASTLLNHGADQEYVSESGWSALMISIWRCDTRIFNLLLENGVRVNSSDPKIHLSPLIYAIRSSNTYFVQSLINRGASVNARSANEKTPLMMAIRNRSTEIARILLKGGADPEALEVEVCVGMKVDAIEISLRLQLDDISKMLIEYSTQKYRDQLCVRATSFGDSRLLYLLRDHYVKKQLCTAEIAVSTDKSPMSLLLGFDHIKRFIFAKSIPECLLDHKDIVLL